MFYNITVTSKDTSEKGIPDEKTSLLEHTHVALTTHNKKYFQSPYETASNTNIMDHNNKVLEVDLDLRPNVLDPRPMDTVSGQI